ncbi:MAG: hypothetical protein K9N55_13830 [Phycisphaerae bacterium]|nr:hypothetical protein [Phycisphaerae bacterium]
MYLAFAYKTRVNSGRPLLAAIIVCIMSGTALAQTVADRQKPGHLIAHWTFDEASGQVCADTSPNGHHAVQGDLGAGPLERIQGVFGNALHFSGQHALQIPGKLDVSSIQKITLCAWVKPAGFTPYNEIFRKEDGDNRILFSFQHHGSILSFGIHVAGRGYQELDAPIDPTDLLDWQWHHVAGVFDGKTMRVYLDGREIGTLAYPGHLVSGGSASAYIGSSGGHGEFFQGAMDDLQIWGTAIGTEQIAAWHEHGIQAALARVTQPHEQLTGMYVEAPTFSETLAGTRRNLIKANRQLTPALTDNLLMRLFAKFKDDMHEFMQCTQSQPLDYLGAEDNAWNLRQAQRLHDLLTEYKPLTEAQWAKQTSTQRKQWQDVERLEAVLNRLKTLGGEATFSPAWIDFMLQAHRRIQYRPTVNEAVAPYIKPYTPDTRDLSRAEAEQRLKQDWLHQADNTPSAQRIMDEITWTKQIMSRIQKEATAPVDFTGAGSDLETLETRARAVSGSDEALYFAVRRVKRRVMFKNPCVDFDTLLFVDIPFPQGSEWPHETRHRLGYMGVPGGRLLTLRGLSPAGHVTKLWPKEPLHGTFWRPDVSFDAQRVLFSFKPANEKNFHLYEMNIDGTGFRQITDGLYDDVDPIYLSDGENIAFVSTRGHNYVRCMPPTNSFTLTRCGLDGKDMYLISRNNEPDYLPALLNDGRIIYTRWEYTDKPLWRSQSLWTMNPDGIGPSTFWGNQSVWPDLLKDARPIPGSARVMFTGAAHHNWFSGSIGIIDPRKELNFPNGLTKVTAEVAWPESGNGPVDPVESPRYHRSGTYRAYQNPYPIGPHDFIVSAQRQDTFVLYLMDTDGNRELLYEGVHHILHAMPVKPRPAPPTLPDAVAWPTLADRLTPKPGIIYSSNVYHNSAPELQGKAKHLRLLTIDAKTYSTWYKRPYASTGPVVSIVQSEGVKRILGTVPIEADGSVSFTVPSGIPIHFQLLDANYCALQTMRSFTGVMPGETRGCLGCHEMHSVAPTTGHYAKALARSPSDIVPPPWGHETVSYLRFVQPVLDTYCGDCHQGEGKARHTLDLTLRPGYSVFKEPYVLLTGHPTWGQPYNPPEHPVPGFGIADTLMVEAFDQRDPAAYVTPNPMTRLSFKSRLIDIASSGTHNDVKVDPVNLRKLIAWVDTMCPFLGDEEVREMPDPEFQGVDWLSIRPQIENAPVVVRPGPIEAGIGYHPSTSSMQ